MDGWVEKSLREIDNSNDRCQLDIIKWLSLPQLFLVLSFGGSFGGTYCYFH